MAQKNPQPAAVAGKKRKDPPSASTKPPTDSKKPKLSHAQQQQQRSQQHHVHRSRQRDARTLATQTTGAAFSHGSMDVDKFVAAREYEIRALEQGMLRSKKALNRRAFQQVPRELRRRTAAHNVKRVPKRLQPRASREMVEDNTPTVTARNRKLTRHMRLRLETVKKLRALGARRKANKEQKEGEKANGAEGGATDTTTGHPGAVLPRKAKIKTAPTLAQPPVPKAKFRKRQKHKSWLPTHLYHAKRAHMTPPSAALWRFAIPLTPTQKSYRPTHRASRERGAVAWDMSYIATIGVEGQQRSVEGVLKGLGVGISGKADNTAVWGAAGAKWRRGTRVLETFAFEREAPCRLIAPVTISWCAPVAVAQAGADEEGKRRRNIFIRVHPSAFWQVWEEAVRLAKVVKPAAAVEDLRFEIGSIELAGPGSTEALLGALKPYSSGSNIAGIWNSLAGLTNTSSLPPSALIPFDVQDPRLHHPPRTIKLPKTQDDQEKLLHLLATWPPDSSPTPSSLFNRISRSRDCKLPSQKSINRRKSLAPPGAYPEPQTNDPKIPVLLHTQPPTSSSQWTLLTPWKTVSAIWQTLMYYPLSTGQQPRLGGLREQQQLAFEAGQAWFPGDCPGTEAGWAWEMQERARRFEAWNKRPKGKRVSWEKVDLGEGRKGEVGKGWACDWEILLEGCEVKKADSDIAAGNAEGTKPNKSAGTAKKEKSLENATPLTKPAHLAQLTPTQALCLLRTPSPPTTDLSGKVVTIRITLLTKGVPQSCARIYRLPSASANPSLRKAWLKLLPSNQSSEAKVKRPPKPHSKGSSTEQQRLLARELLAGPRPRAGETTYPACPGQEDLIGFVTTGNFNLAEGQGTGIGCLMLEKVVGQEGWEGLGKTKEGQLCVVRNAGESVGRLGRWNVV